MDGIQLAEYIDQWWAVVTTVMNLRFSRFKDVIVDGIIHTSLSVCNFFGTCVTCEAVIGGCKLTPFGQDRIRQVG
jgi:hypothetical protein